MMTMEQEKHHSSHCHSRHHHSEEEEGLEDVGSGTKRVLDFLLLRPVERKDRRLKGRQNQEEDERARMNKRKRRKRTTTKK